MPCAKNVTRRKIEFNSIRSLSYGDDDDGSERILAIEQEVAIASCIVVVVGEPKYKPSYLTGPKSVRKTDTHTHKHPLVVYYELNIYHRPTIT